MQLPHANDNIVARLQWTDHLLKKMPDYVYVYNVVEQRNVYANRDMGAILGYTLEELQRMGSALLAATHMGSALLATIMHPDDFAQLPAIFQRILEAADGTVVEWEYRVRNRNGGWVWLQDRMSVFSRDGQGHVVEYVGVVQEITARKQVEEELHTFKTLIEHMTEGVAVNTADTTFVYANPAYQALTGQGSAVLGKTIFDVYQEPPETLAAAAEMAIAQGSWQGDLTIQQPGGTTLPCQVSVTTLYGDDGNPRSFLAVARDSTERTQHAADLHLWQFALDHASDIVEFLDPTGRFVYVNKQACQHQGYTRAELLTMHLADIDPTHSNGRWEAVWNHIKQAGKLTEESVHRRKDGSTFPVEISAAYLSVQGRELIVAFVRDISARKQQEDELRAFKTLVETSPDGIGIAGLDSTIIYANPALQTFSGYGAALRGMTISQLYPDEEQAEVAHVVGQLRAHGTWQGPMTLLDHVGQRTPVQMTAFAIRDAQGQPVSLTGVFHDLTTQRRAEAERAALQQQIIDAQRAALRELSTPLIPITDDVMIMPLIGTIDSGRARMIMEALLEGVARHQARLVILDITGVAVVDTQVAQAFIQAAQAVQLLGAQVMLTGIQPQIAQTLVALGVDLRGIITRGSLQAGIHQALREVR